MPCPNRAQLVSWASSVVTWVTANTNTRSQKSSTAVVRRSGVASGAGDASLMETKYRRVCGARLIGYRA